ncbi:MAG: DUF4442 domain-containing protein [Chloroflexi bacterium]|nr:DUF4442 domain-containing protein [Chloroflexota bacterium]
MKTWQIFRERLINLYPPFLGAGIRARRIDERTYEVRLILKPFNRNLVGTHFGGSLYAMCDPWFMLILIRLLGNEYIVWDKQATIQFIRPGRGTVKALFQIPPERVDQIRSEADRLGRTEPIFSADVLDSEGQVVARVEKLLYVRRKDRAGIASE